MHCAVILIGPGGVGKNALDAQADFGLRLFFPHHGGQPAGHFFAALGKVLRHVIEHLRAIMRRRSAPAFRFAGCLDGVANVFAVAHRRLSEQTPVRAVHFAAVT